MKKILLPLFFLFLLSLNVNSQVRTVSNNVNTPGQYTNLQEAINAAVPGDTIYVHGSPSGYGNITVNKRLTFIGPGFNPQSQFNLGAYITTITLDSIIPTSGAKGSVFIGLNIGNFAKKTTDIFQIDNIIIDRCRIASTVKTYCNGNNWVFKDCFFSFSGYNVYVDIDYYSNILITNSFFLFSPITTPNVAAIANSNKSSVIVNNNIFTGYHQGGSFENVINAQFSNNIFFGKSPQGAGSSVFEKNLTYASTQTQLPYGTNTGNSNFVNVDPQFVNIPVNTFTFSFAYDFHLQPSSPGINAGTDGTDIGIFGGGYPMPTNSNIITGESRLPQIYYMNILNNVIDQNTPINVTVKARKMN